MRDERTNSTDRDTAADTGQYRHVDSASRTRPGLRASILAGLTVGAAAVVTIGSGLSTVVSHAGMGA